MRMFGFRKGMEKHIIDKKEQFKVQNICILEEKDFFNWPKM